MRTFVLLLVLALPPLVACGAAYANTSTDIGKPVCTHFDDSGKPTSRTTSAASTPTPAVSAANTPAASPVQPTTGMATATQAKGGGTAGMLRPRSSPHWQTFLPGMFK